MIPRPDMPRTLPPLPPPRRAAQPLLDLPAQRRQRLRQTAADAGGERAQLRRPPAHVALEVGALAAALGVESAERRPERAIQRRPLAPEVGRFLADPRETRQAGQRSQRRTPRPPRPADEVP